MPLSQAELDRVSASAIQLYGPGDIHAALDRMAGEITAELEGTLPVVICVLTGGIIPVSYTHLTLPTKVLVCRSRWSPYH